MDLVSCKEAYRSLSKTIFEKSSFAFPGKKAFDAVRGAPWYSGGTPQSSIMTTVAERLSRREKNELVASGQSPQDALMKDSRPDATKT